MMTFPSATPATVHIDALRLLRPTVLVIDQVGIVLQAHGGAGRPLGYLPEELIGRHGLELIAPEDQHAMIEMAMGTEGAPVVLTPEPFPLRVVGPDGRAKVWDCAPTGFSQGDQAGWVMAMTCRNDQSAALEAMDSFIEGNTALEITAEIARRYQHKTADGWRKNTLIVHRSTLDVDEDVSSWKILDPLPDTEPRLVEGLTRCLDDPRAPWNTMDPGNGGVCHDLPVSLRIAADAVELSNCTALAVGIEGRSRIVLLRFSNFAHPYQSNSKLADKALESVLTRALLTERSQELLLDASRCDPLTGILNRLAFDEAVAETESTTGAAVLFVDIDRFKHVNDTFGHSAGDATLRQVAGRIVKACRPEDLVARVGGDEFAVILHNVSADDARRVAARIQAAMAEPLPNDDGPTMISVTIGIGAPDPKLSLTELVRVADHAMLRQKAPNHRDAVIDVETSTLDIRSDRGLARHR